MTPQANTTVEAECWTLLLPHMSLINARLTSEKDTIEARLVDYTTKFGAVAEEFANAPVVSIAAACTGASYLIGAEKEAQIVDAVEAARGVPFLTAALCSVAALRQIGAKRIALLTPYPAALNELSTGYWEGHGFEVVAKAGPALETEAFHPIYAMAAGGVLRAYEDLSDSGADAVLMLGTGMATLRPILAGRLRGLLPAVSCNLALVWAAHQGKRWDALDNANLAKWLAGDHWAPRLDALFPEKS
jgi:maleate cis-trans isomerase